MQRLRIIFDLDGTLVDTKPDLLVAVNTVLSDFGCRSINLKELETAVGKGAQHLINKSFHISAGAHSFDEHELLAAFMEAYEKNACSASKLYDGVIELLDWLQSQKIDLAICTNKDYELALYVLRTLRLDKYFKAVIGDNLPKMKPDPEPVLAAMEGLAPAQKTLLIGDTSTDLKAANAAGIASAAVTYGFGKGPFDVYSPLFVAASVQQLKEQLATLIVGP